MQQKKLAFIGGGNMAGSLIGGLVDDGWPADLIQVADPDLLKLELLQQRHPGIQITTDNDTALQQADAVVLAVKPQMLHQVASSLQKVAQSQRPLVISIAAGIREQDISNWLGGSLPVVRCMPNTPALVQSGATGLYANPHTSESQKALAETILRATGIVVWVKDEPMLDAVTALSGSGPAYFFLVMESMQAAATELGLDPSVAELLTIQTALGAARLALESDEDVATLRQRVTSKGGTTEAALQVLEKGHIRALFADAMTAAENRSRELADEFGKNQG